MKTIYTIFVMFVACAVGLPIFKVMMHVMGAAGSPGAIIHAEGRKRSNYKLRRLGLIITTIGQAFVVGSYAVLAVVVLRWYLHLRPDLPTWPLWLAAAFHALGITIEALEHKPSKPTAQHDTVVPVSMIGFAIFIVAIFFPIILMPLFGWIPRFETLLNR